MAAASPRLFSMKAEEHSHGAEVPGEAGGDWEWRVAAAKFTPRRQAHSLLRNAGDAKCPCGIGNKWRQHAATPSRGAAMPRAGRVGPGSRAGRTALRVQQLIGVAWERRAAVNAASLANRMRLRQPRHFDGFPRLPERGGWFQARRKCPSPCSPKTACCLPASTMARRRNWRRGLDDSQGADNDPG